MDTWSVTLLGPVAVLKNGAALPLGGQTARAVFAALALRGRTGAGTEELITTVWGGPGEVGRDSVYQYIKKLRGVLGHPQGPQIVTAAPGRYQLAVDDVVLDWWQFQRLVDEARLAANAGRREAAAELFAAALSRWPGAALADVGDRLPSERRRLAEERLVVVEELASLEAALGHPQRVHDLLRPELARLPDREIAAALLVDSLTALGRREEAGALFHQIRQHLSDHLGLDPSPALVAAHRHSLTGSPSLSPAGPPLTPGVELAVVPTATRGRRPVGPVAPAVGVDASMAASAWGLPRPDRHFTGRREEMASIVDWMSADEWHDPICVISGMAGVGKTALAAHAAARLASRYPGGCFFLDLRGYSPGFTPVEPAEALDRVLRRLGVPGERIPPDPDERTALYRGLIVGRRVLLVLDNARSVAQVEPLLPGASGCGVLITSRTRMTALDDAHFTGLSVLPAIDAAGLFRAVAGAERLRDEPDAERAIGRIVARCGSLPLAVRIAAARHRTHTLHTLADLDSDLAAARSPLTALDDGERNVAASLTVSLTDLSDELRRVLALLAAHPFPDVDGYAAAALLATPVDRVGRQLDALTDRHLLMEHSRGRYRFHDLVAVFAHEYALRTLPPDERHAALRRLVDFYLRAAEVADTIITPHRARARLDLVDESALLPDFPGYDDAFGWLTAEQTNLIELCLLAGSVGLDGPCWQFAFLLRGYFFLTRRWEPWYATHAAALAAARRCSDARAEAITLNNLGLAHLEQGELTEAARLYRDALRLFREVGDGRGENTVRANRAWILFAQGRFAAFVDELNAVLRFYQGIGSDHNAAITLRGIGLAETELGRYDEAVQHLLEALGILAHLDVRLDKAMTLNGLGRAYQRSGDAARAAAALADALVAGQRCGSEYEMARAHHSLGDIAHTAGDEARAHDHWLRAFDAYRVLGATEAADVAGRLGLPA